MGFVKDRRLIAICGAAVALTAGLLLAWVLLGRGRAPSSPPPASQGGLVVVSGRDDDAKLDPTRPLRCFVGGQFVGELPLALCAQRNGVATGGLDVGLDQSGALAASNGTDNEITPLPSVQPPQAPPNAALGPAMGVAESAPPAGPVQPAAAACWRYGASGWRLVQALMPLHACVETLYAGRCPGADETFYGRWGDQTLRLIGGRVEISADNRNFSSLVDPWPPCEGDPG